MFFQQGEEINIFNYFFILTYLRYLFEEEINYCPEKSVYPC